MNISRKEFFKKSLMSLGETLCTIGKALQAPAALPKIPDTNNFNATPCVDLVAIAYNDLCLAKNSGCFACLERCEPGAIKLNPGVGVRVNQRLCNGCGSCEYVCPVTPKAIRMQARTVPTPSVDHPEIPPQKGDSPC